MPLCTNGSEPAPDAPPYVWVTWLDARSWLGTVWGVLGWIGIATSAIIHETAVFCATEPPQPVAPSDADIIAAATDPVKFEQLLAYIEQSATWWVWSNVCVCTTPVAGTCYPVLPTTALGSGSSDLLNYRFGTELYAKVAGLTIYGVTVRLATAGAGTFGVQLIDQHAGTVHLETFAGVAGLHTYYFATPLAMVNVGSGNIYDVVLRFNNAGYTFTFENVNVTPADTVQLHYNKFIYQSDLTSSMTDWSPAHLPMDPVICTADPNPEPYTPGDPPEPPTALPPLPSLACSSTDDLCTLVNQLVVQLAQTRSQVDLVQRQAVPFAYILGAVHPGLTGTGTVAIAGLIGLLVEITAHPAHWGSTNDDPPRFIPAVASIAVSSADGWQDQHFVHLVEELWFPTAMSAMTGFTYAFRPGVTGRITELKREA